MVARLVKSVDFERVLGTRSRMSSAHFAVHHVAEAPRSVSARRSKPVLGELSTGGPPQGPLLVDDFPESVPGCPWLGVVVPKRHARRSVTRSLLKRQIRAVAMCADPGLPAGLWVVRLRAPFDKLRFVSAASRELRELARVELEGLFDGVLKRIAAGA